MRKLGFRKKKKQNQKKPPDYHIVNQRHQDSNPGQRDSTFYVCIDHFCSNHFIILIISYFFPCWFFFEDKNLERQRT